MHPVQATEHVAELARALGFSLCGVAPAADFPELERIPEWLARGYAGQMHYLADLRRTSPARVLEGARSLIVCALLYNTAKPLSTEFAGATGHMEDHRQEPSRAISAEFAPDTSPAVPRGWISRYAWGDDYHQVLGDKLEHLVAALHVEFPEPFEARPYVDTGPVAERIAAKHAGLGWLGKNTCLIHPELGSWLFLGVIVTTLELAPTLGSGDSPQPDLCGQCSLCIDACPTGALVAPYQMDARRCISYLTIEHRGPLPEELRPALGGHVFGCDICQDVCPFNRKAPVNSLVEFAPRKLLREGGTRKTKFENRSQPHSAVTVQSGKLPVPSPEDLFAPPLEWLAALTEEEYRKTFRGSALKRAKYQGMVRNACVALGNTAGRFVPATRTRFRALLEHLAASPDPIIAEHATWALARLAAR